ncbi:hypothetical protein Y1Q_0017203 [Alligator mississippiensis]|uniref:Uncharacterized protein n=1 Tax=Alligator mississippiensis TaxID=8496 RepID=A0A151NL31_ALLMI|nr:hypothetical protein Y1Q_0017203 [Alligator mississippiensis]
MGHSTQTGYCRKSKAEKTQKCSADSTLLHCSNKIRLTSFSGEDPCFPPVSNSLKYKTGITYHKKIIHSTPNQDNHFNHAPNTQQNV